MLLYLWPAILGGRVVLLLPNVSYVDLRKLRRRESRSSYSQDVQDWRSDHGALVSSEALARFLLKINRSLVEM